jgi:Ca2+-binding RTX toxin-like protein
VRLEVLALFRGQWRGSFRLCIAAFAVVAIVGASPGETSSATLECFGAAVTKAGTEADDQLTGTPGPDVIAGLGGNDIINGLGGDDRICGGLGAFDLINGGPGDDLLDGGTDTTASPLEVPDGDVVDYSTSAGPVNVDLKAGRATGDGADTVMNFEAIAGSQFGDTLIGTDGANNFFGLLGNDVIRGGGGVDSVSYGLSRGAVRVDLGAHTASGEGADQLLEIESVGGSPNDDIIAGDGGDNTLSGSGGNDQIDGRAGRDSVGGGAGNDRIAGGIGQDFIQFLFSPTGVTADLAAGRSSGEGTDTFSGFEHAIGSAHDDRLSGNTLPNALIPLAGNDVLQGRGGHDDAWFTFSTVGVQASLSSGRASGEGSDRMSGVENLLGSLYQDTLTGDGHANALFGFSGDDVIRGGAGGDLLVGDFTGDELAGNDRLFGEAGNDLFNGGPRNDEYVGGTGTADQASYALSSGGVTANLATGTAEGDGTDRMGGIEGLRGSIYADKLTGDGRPNQISGDSGNDELDGGGNDDFLSGGGGVDTLNAAAGRDYCLDERRGSGCEIRGLPAGSPGARFAEIGQSVETSNDVGQPSCGTTGTRSLSGIAPDAVRRPPPRRRRYRMAIAPPQQVRPTGNVPALSWTARIDKLAGLRPPNIAPSLRALAHVSANGKQETIVVLTRRLSLETSFERWWNRLPLRALQVDTPDPSQIEIFTWRATLHRYDAAHRRWVVYKRMAPATAVINPSGAATWTNRAGDPVAMLSVEVGPGRFAWSGDVRGETGGGVSDWAEPHVSLSSAAGGLFQPWCDLGGK